MSYFEEMGKMLAAQMARDPRTRDRADAAIRKHLGMPAMDAMPMAMRPRVSVGRDQDPQSANYPDPSDPQDGPVSAEECLSFLQLALTRMPPEEADQLVAALAQMIEEAHAGSGGVSGGGTDPALDQRPRRLSARDRQAQDAAFAARARNTANFLKRWPQLQNLEVWR